MKQLRADLTKIDPAAVEQQRASSHPPPPVPPQTPADCALALEEDIKGFEYDPAGYIRYAFPWGKPGTDLEHMRPRKWLLRLCARIRKRMLENVGKPANQWRAVQEAIASGNGIGKSAGAMQLMLWAMSTFDYTRGVVTANTDTQLRTKTWPELIKWHSMCINKHWFTVTATAIFANGASFLDGSMRDKDKRIAVEKNWRIDAIPWSVENLEAFQGLHNLGKRIFVFLDEASGIADKIWEVVDRYLTDAGTQIIWIAFGNPTRSAGRFRECWTKFRLLWGVENVDARTVEGTNAVQHEAWRLTYGEQSQWFQISVAGQFVEADANQLIALQWITEARMRGYQAASDGSRRKLRVSVDVSDGGEDSTVFTAMEHYDTIRIGLKQSVASYQHSVAVIEAATAARTMFDAWGGDVRADDIVVDRMGVGAGTAGTLIKHRTAEGQALKVIGYAGGEASDDPKKFRCRRVQSYMALRNDLRDGGLALRPDFCANDDEWKELEAQLCSVKSRITIATVDKVEDLITREEMRRMGIKSPDRADSLAMQYVTHFPQQHGPANPAPRAARVVRSDFLTGADW